MRFPRVSLIISFLGGILAALPGGEGNKLGKAPVPEAGAQLLAAGKIKEVFHAEYAKRGAADRLALARKLLQLGEETRDDAVRRFVLYREARDLAIEAGEVLIAFQSIDAMARDYAVDGQTLMVEALGSLSRVARGPKACAPLAERGLALVEEAIARDEFDGAARLAADVLGLAAKAGDASLVFQAKALQERADALKRENDRLQSTLKALKEKGDDAGANLARGRFFASWKEDWEKALPLLAASRSPGLEETAKRDLSAPKLPRDQRDLAAAWASFSEKQSGPARKALERRAIAWYEKALAGLTGLEKAEVEKQIASLMFGPAKVWETHAGETGAVLGGESANVLKEFTAELWFATEAERIALLTKRCQPGDGSLTFLLWEGSTLVIGDADYYRVDAGGPVRSSDGRWHHLAAVKSNTRVKVYLDGKPLGEMETRPGFLSKSAWVLGRKGTFGAETEPARFAKIRLSKAARYPGPFTPQTDYGSDRDTLFLK